MHRIDFMIPQEWYTTLPFSEVCDKPAYFLDFGMIHISKFSDVAEVHMLREICDETGAHLYVGHG